MKFGQRSLTMASMGFGLMAAGILSLAVVTDYWLFTSEPIHSTIYLSDNGTSEYISQHDYEESVENSGQNATFTGSISISTKIEAHSGLWRMCMISEEMESPSCSVINYLYQDWKRISDADTTWSILRAIRKSSPVVVFSLLLMFVAFTLATVGNTRRDFRTITGAVLYVFAALFLAVGMIIYMSAVTDEASHRKEPSPDGGVFEYHYGWAFFFTGASFICAMLAAVANITLYLGRYTTVEDMTSFIPGLDSSQSREFSKVSTEEDLQSAMCSQNINVTLTL